MHTTYKCYVQSPKVEICISSSCFVHVKVPMMTFMRHVIVSLFSTKVLWNCANTPPIFKVLNSTHCTRHIATIMSTFIDNDYHIWCHGIAICMVLVSIILIGIATCKLITPRPIYGSHGPLNTNEMWPWETRVTCKKNHNGILHDLSLKV